MIRCAVCDDEPRTREQLSALLAGFRREQAPLFHVECFPSGAALLDCPHGFDLIFLDIQMPPPDGMETARQLRQRGFQGLLLFITVLREAVYDAFAVQAWDYLLKPLDQERFRRTMDRALLALERRESPRLLLQGKQGRQVIPFEEITFCEVLGRRIDLHRRSGTTAVHTGRLEALEHQLDSRFFRCHRSYLVNLDEVRHCAGGRITLSDGSEVPLSRLREAAFTQALLRRMKGRVF